MLSVALCDHFQHVRLSLAGWRLTTRSRTCCFWDRPVGKTHLIRSAAELIGVPFVQGSATKFSETGYVGGDGMTWCATWSGRPAARPQGIPRHHLPDEVDKLATRGETGARDASGRGCRPICSLMEDGDVPLVSPNDVTASSRRP